MAQTPEQIAARWASQMAQSTEKLQQGVQDVQVAPGTVAARQGDVWAANVAAAKDKWKRNVASVSLQDWQAAMINKGLPRIAQGAQAAQPRMAQFMAQLLPHISTLRNSLPPRGNLEANIARMTAFTRGMAKFQASK